jgi:hypothetical protein
MATYLTPAEEHILESVTEDAYLVTDFPLSLHDLSTGVVRSFSEEEIRPALISLIERGYVYVAWQDRHAGSEEVLATDEAVASVHQYFGVSIRGSDPRYELVAVATPSGREAYLNRIRRPPRV